MYQDLKLKCEALFRDIPEDVDVTKLRVAIDELLKRVKRADELMEAIERGEI